MTNCKCENCENYKPIQWSCFNCKYCFDNCHILKKIHLDDSGKIDKDFYDISKSGFTCSKWEKR